MSPNPPKNPDENLSPASDRLRADGRVTLLVGGVLIFLLAGSCTVYAAVSLYVQPSLGVFVPLLLCGVVTVLAGVAVFNISRDMISGRVPTPASPFVKPPPR